ncbi:MAG TPA: GNAT family N-acetyltransferase [Candidatus Dormibacteraeota bacterium]|nr:GNAT family N-acetyltransferase [Candidatus Dormibacteraeota bacterium]
MNDTAKTKIRRARSSDAARLAELAGELGYPTTAKEIRQRLSRLQPSTMHAVFVAEACGEVIGWLHVSRNYVLESPVRAEVNGLVVSAAARSQGAGKLLLRAAEEWARKHKCTGVNLRSNVLRDRAHKFYEREGYEHYKTQKAFRKPL